MHHEEPIIVSCNNNVQSYKTSDFNALLLQCYLPKKTVKKKRRKRRDRRTCCVELYMHQFTGPANHIARVALCIEIIGVEKQLFSDRDVMDQAFPPGSPTTGSALNAIPGAIHWLSREGIGSYFPRYVGLGKAWNHSGFCDTGTAAAQIFWVPGPLLSQERVKLRTSKFCNHICNSIWTKAR